MSDHCSKSRIAYLSCSCRSPTRSAAALSRAWRVHVVTPPASRISNSTIGGNWLELIKQIAPHTTRMAVLRDPNIWMAPNWPVPLALAQSHGVEVSPIGLPNASEIERGITEFAEKPNGGLIISPNPFAFVHRELIISLANRYRLPAIYPSRYFATDGGLISYGPDAADQYRRAAGYVDRILKGKKPAHLPVEQSTKVALVINMKTAKALGLDVPPTLLATADEVLD